MTGIGSIQLRLYLRARRAGAACLDAAAYAGIGAKEARFTDEDEARGLLDAIELAIPRSWFMRQLGALASTPLGEAAMRDAG
jgi:hypothetical protein